ncbi:hypothetical protein ABW21_db0206108 [Orbilia brochopaga]|nr:hypothetical protein ABW21_db0206108 [Drechslerella brochopaga]
MRSSAIRLLRPLARLSAPHYTSAIRTAPRPAPPSRISPPTLSATSRKYSSIDSPSILPPPAQNDPSAPVSQNDTSTPAAQSSSSANEPTSPASTTASFKLPEKPAFEMTFTCRKCQTRSTHRVSKQAYHKGTVLILCPGCNVQHLIADHLKIFRDKPTTIEDILREKGESVRKGIKYHDGDIEFLPPEPVDAGEASEAGEAEVNPQAASKAKTDAETK